MLTHSCLAVGFDGVARGILHLKSWCREEDGTRADDRANLPIEQKESIRWLDTARAAHAGLEKALRPEERPRICHMGDRENDIHEFFALVLELGDAAVVRCARNRRVETEDGQIALAHASISASPCRGAIEVAVPRHEGQPARKVIVEVRFEKQTLKPSSCAPLQRKRGEVPLWLVEVREAGEPPKGVEPLHWMLWTTEPVTSLEEAVRIVEIYRLRWRIEDYHRALKEGCRIEKVRFETAQRLQLAVALYAPVAARIVEIRDTARLCPDAPCTILFTETEWRVLWTMKKKQWPANGQSPPTVEQAVRWTGNLGGHLGRKGDGMPGTKSIWRGLAKLNALTEYEVTRQQLIDQGSSP